MIVLRFLIAVLITVSSTAVLALEPERREVIVTHNRVWDGFAYHESFVPSDQAEMLLLSDVDNAVTFVRTQEYYWPLARQKYVAFDTQRDEITGILRIFDGGSIVEEVTTAPYVVVYPEGAVNGDARLVWGEQAIQAFAEYRQGERDFVRKFASAQHAQSAYNKALREAGITRLAGEGVHEVTAPPPPPKPSLKLVTEPKMAFRVALAVGNYQSEVMLDGAVVPGSQKAIRVIETAAREAVIAEIIPEERWTRPIPTNTGVEKIYTTPGTVFYATLAHASGFDEADYIGLTRPQGAAVKGREIWVKRKPANFSEMQVDWGNGAQAELRSPIKVQQTRGAEFGYVVRAAAEGERPDLQAFTLTVPNNATVRRGIITVHGDAGVQLTREIVVVQPRNVILTWFLALLPMLFGMAWVIRRRYG